MKNNHFAENLERLMKEHGDTPVDLMVSLRLASMDNFGRYTGHKVSATWLRRLIQNPEQNTSWSLLEAIAALYGVEVWELLVPPKGGPFKYVAFGFWRLVK